jgi:diaminohydroxyphosphoribosylaminopyrimidine deaminase/5-amino-6-(5-phosphoribosylamino)uracil reductase
MRLALRLARRGYGSTSPNPMVGAVLVKGATIIGRGWHRRAGEPHAEIEAIRDAQKAGHDPKGATLYVTLEPCSTHGRTPPCTEAIIEAGIKRVVVGATDPNPKHRGQGFSLLKQGGLRVESAVLAEKCERLNESFNHWIVNRTPFVTVKAAMTLDGKIATAAGESKWITGEKARACGMKMRQGVDAILVGINTILADDPRLSFRSQEPGARSREPGVGGALRRIVLDPRARTPLGAKVVSDEQGFLTTIVVGKEAPKSKVQALEKRVRVLVAPARNGRINLRWLLKRLGTENVTSLLAEGGGEVNASFLLGGLAQRIVFFYAPKILGGRDSLKGVAGEGATRMEEALNLTEVEWRRIGQDLMLRARVEKVQNSTSNIQGKSKV